MMIKGNINPAIKIIPTSTLPMKIQNEDTGEWETINMFARDDKIYVTNELYAHLKKEVGGDTDD